MKVLSINKEHSFSDEKIAFNIKDPLGKEVIEKVKNAKPGLFSFEKNENKILIINMPEDWRKKELYCIDSFQIIKEAEKAITIQRKQENEKRDKLINFVSDTCGYEIS